MPKEIVSIDPSNTNLEGAATLFAYGAFPDKPESREKFIAAIQGQVGRQRDKESVLKTGFKRFTRLEIVAKTMRQLVESEKSPNSRKQVFDSTVNTLIGCYSYRIGVDGHSQEDELDLWPNNNRDNNYKRDWKPCKPVLHLYYGLAERIMDTQLRKRAYSDRSGDEVTLYLIKKGHLWIPQALEVAEEYRQELINSPKFRRISESSTIQFCKMPLK